MIGSEEILAAVRPRLRHFLAVHGDEAITLLKQHTDCQPLTISGWFGTSEPPAQPLIKIWHLLDLLGYESPEMAQIDPLQKFLGRLFATGVIDIEKLRELLSITVTQTAVQFLRGQPSMKLKADALEGLRETYDEELVAKVSAIPMAGFKPVDLADLDVAPALAATARANATVEAASPVGAHEPPNQPVLERSEAQSATGTLPALNMARIFDSSDPALTLAVALGVVAPFARQLVLEAGPEERARFRMLLGEDVPTLNEIVLVLDALRTRAAHEQYMRERV